GRSALAWAVAPHPRSPDGRPEAKDTEEQDPQAPGFELDARRPRALDVPHLRCGEAPPRGVRELRHLPRAPGPRRLLVAPSRRERRGIGWASPLRSTAWAWTARPTRSWRARAAPSTSWASGSC